MGSPKEILSPAEFTNYRNVRAVALWFMILGAILFFGGIATVIDKEPDASKRLPVVVVLGMSVIGLAGAVGGMAVRCGNRGWSPLVKVMAWIYIWGFPLGTILSLTLLKGLSRYLKSVERIRRAESEGENWQDQLEEEESARRSTTRASLECQLCGSTSVRRRPPSQISPHPGYECGNCGTLMRAPGMLPVHLIVLAIGGGLAGLFVYLLATGHAGPEAFIAPLIGAVCAVYSIRQMLRPAPRNSRRNPES